MRIHGDYSLEIAWEKPLLAGRINEEQAVYLYEGTATPTMHTT